DALDKMRGVYEQNPQMGDPLSLEPQITHTSQTIGRLKGELSKYELWLLEAAGGEDSSHSTINNNTGIIAKRHSSSNAYSEFDDEFDDIESPVGQCSALYTFEGNSEGTISIKEGELLSIMEEDKGDGWMRSSRRLKSQRSILVFIVWNSLGRPVDPSALISLFGVPEKS
ncbi:hypothetical protein CHARACLAT_014523, partial [Characodon lateralis]|nr:hypothetical protein [Characodon lateralis]